MAKRKYKRLHYEDRQTIHSSNGRTEKGGQRACCI